uniref:hypothetical protein n=1 Tax=Candidatus Cryptobacteroides bacterium TaxID=3085639 RepID=UPI004027B89E
LPRSLALAILHYIAPVRLSSPRRLDPFRQRPRPDAPYTCDFNIHIVNADGFRLSGVSDFLTETRLSAYSEYPSYEKNEKLNKLN